MTISSYQIHNVLRTYGRQLRKSPRQGPVKESQPEESTDRVRISPETKRLQVIEQVTMQILNNLAASGVQNEGVEAQVISRLSQEFGSPLALQYEGATGEFVFNIVDQERGEILRTLDPDESRQMNQRLVEVTREIVDQTML